jgi:transcriptional regulator with XRE-family HTH domain
VEHSLSASIVKALRDEGRTLKEIGDLLGLSESFMSRVARGERNLTVAHIERLQQVVEEPFMLRVLESMQHSAKPKFSKAHEGAIGLLQAATKLDVELQEVLVDQTTGEEGISDTLVEQASRERRALDNLAERIRPKLRRMAGEFAEIHNVDPEAVFALVCRCVSEESAGDRRTLALRKVFISRDGNPTVRVIDLLRGALLYDHPSTALSRRLRMIVNEEARRLRIPDSNHSRCDSLN